jgi:hypothetical protein
MLHRLSHTELFWSDSYARTFALILMEQEVPELTDMKFEVTKLLWSSSWNKFLEANFVSRREYDRQTLMSRVFTFVDSLFVVLETMPPNPFWLGRILMSLMSLWHPPLLRPSLSLLHRYLELYYIAHEKKDSSRMMESLGDTQCLSSAAEHLRRCAADEMSTIVQIWLQTNKLLTKENGREEASFPFIHAFYSTLIHKTCLLDLGGTLLRVLAAHAVSDCCLFDLYPGILLMREEVSRQSPTTSIPDKDRQNLRDAILHFIKHCAPLPSQKTHSSLFFTLLHNPFTKSFDKLWIRFRLKHWAIFAFALTLITQDLENDAPDEAKRILPRLWDWADTLPTLERQVVYVILTGNWVPSNLLKAMGMLFDAHSRCRF